MFYLTFMISALSCGKSTCKSISRKPSIAIFPEVLTDVCNAAASLTPAMKCINIYRKIQMSVAFLLYLPLATTASTDMDASKLTAALG